MPVSVVIPAFRAMATLARAVRSVATQTAVPCELIVVDDGSADGTAEQARSLASHYSEGWLRVLEQAENLGAGSARNAGWAVATGEFIAFLDADDYWLPGKIEHQYSYMQAHPEITLCGHAHRFSADPTPDASLENKPGVHLIAPHRLLISNPMVTPSVMVRANIPFRFMPGKRYMEDHLLWMELALSGLRVAKLDASLTVIGKAAYGAGGLSAQMWAMEKGDLQNYWYLRKTGRIGLPTALFMMMLSLAKYGRRLAVVGLRRLTR